MTGRRTRRRIEAGLGCCLQPNRLKHPVQSPEPGGDGRTVAAGDGGQCDHHGTCSHAGPATVAAPARGRPPLTVSLGGVTAMTGTGPAPAVHAGSLWTSLRRRSVLVGSSQLRPAHPLRPAHRHDLSHQFARLRPRSNLPQEGRRCEGGQAHFDGFQVRPSAERGRGGIHCPDVDRACPTGRSWSRQESSTHCADAPQVATSRTLSSMVASEFRESAALVDIGPDSSDDEGGEDAGAADSAGAGP